MRWRTYEYKSTKQDLSSVSPNAHTKRHRKKKEKTGYSRENNNINLAHERHRLRDGRGVRAEVDHREADGGAERLRRLRDELQCRRVHAPVRRGDGGDEARDGGGRVGRGVVGQERGRKRDEERRGDDLVPSLRIVDADGACRVVGRVAARARVLKVERCVFGDCVGGGWG